MKLKIKIPIFLLKLIPKLIQSKIFQLLIKFLKFRPKKELKFSIKLFQWCAYILTWIFIVIFCIDINLFWLFGKSPHVHQINNPKQSIASELYSADGVLLAKYFNENRTPVKYQDLSSDLVNCLIYTEDARFYSHHGYDIMSTFGILKSLSKGEKRGGSTITQQLVKNLFKTRSNYSRGLFGYIPIIKIFIYKVKEILTSLKIELFYSKQEILTMYFNTVDFGSNIFGIKTASKSFFKQNPKELSVENAALLIGILKAPTYYSPISHPDRATQRRNLVLKQLLKYEYINSKQYDSIIIKPLYLNYSTETNYDGKALYFRQAVTKELRDWLNENQLDLYSDGLKIYTSIDSRMQNYAEESVKEHLTRLQRTFNDHWRGKNPWVDENNVEIPNFIETIAAKTKYYKIISKKFNSNIDSINHYINLPRKMTVFSWKGDRDTSLSLLDSIRYSISLLHSGFIAMDPFDGSVKAWVGGIDYKYFKFDHVKQSKRQPGSTFKAFLYAAALDYGYAPCDTKMDVPVTLTYYENGKLKSWSPHNADWVFSGQSMSLKHAFAKSVNSIAVQLVKEIGWKKVIEYAHKLGIKSTLANVPSVCLGSSAVSLYELVDAYCAFINGGNKVEPLLVTKIANDNGKTIYKKEPITEKVLSDETAYLMMMLLWGGLTEPGGTTQALFEYDLFNYKTDFGGKTGTSSEHSDGWFVGVTPRLVAGAWVGADDVHVHFLTSELGEGCKTALPIYGKFMEKVLADKNFSYLKEKFPKPKTKIYKNYNCHTYYTKKDTLKADSIIVK